MIPLSTLDIASVLSDSIEQLKCPGILCAVSDGKETMTFSAGNISARDHRKPFYIYSITKTFTATAVLRLFEENGLSLDSRFAEFFPRTSILPSVTIRQMLNHTGGLSDYFSFAEYQHAVREHPDEPWPRDQLMRVGLEKTPLFAPGKGWSYSNPGYALLNGLIEHLSGMDWHAYLQKMIFDPLGLTNTRPFLQPDHAGQLLEAYEPSIQGDFRKRYSPGWIAPGCLISTATDIARFFHALFSSKLLSASSLEQMKQTVDVPHPLPPPLLAAYGLGLMHVRNDPLGNAYGHGGGGPGYTTYAQCHPSLCGAPFSLCFVINQSLPTTPLEIAAAISRAFFNFRSQNKD
jgi:D-alanyl-D-alanine carboxypeptidase